MNNLLLEIKNGIATVTLNREKAYNALNSETLAELDLVINRLNEEKEVKIVVFTGKGKAFIAGADIREMTEMSETEARLYSETGADLFCKIEQMDKVTVAAINGFCLGGGLELSLACDLRLATPFAKFGQPEVTLGITPGFSATQRLPKIIGIAKAKEMIFFGKSITAQEALDIHLIHKMIDSEDFLSGVYSYLETILNNSQTAIINAKRALNEGFHLPVGEAVKIETHYFAKCFGEYDQKEGMHAFLEKRKANFK